MEKKSSINEKLDLTKLINEVSKLRASNAEILEKLGGKGDRSKKKTRKLRSKLEACWVNPGTPSVQEDQRVMYQHDPVGACASSQPFSGFTKPGQQYSSP